MRRKGKRGLSDEDRAVWDSVRRSVTPISPVRRSKLAPPAPNAPDPAAPDNPNRKPPALPDLPGIGSARAGPAPGLHVDHAPSLSERLAQAPVQMDRKAYLRLKRGKTKPEARIDLHGMTQAQAHPALTRFLLEAHDRDYRLVLVITGKGRTGADDGPIPERRGVLKHQVPHWLSTGPLRQIVQQVTEAHMRHGGGGAYYVYLRRRK